MSKFDIYNKKPKYNPTREANSSKGITEAEKIRKYGGGGKIVKVNFSNENRGITYYEHQFADIIVVVKVAGSPDTGEVNWAGIEEVKPTKDFNPLNYYGSNNIQRSVDRIYQTLLSKYPKLEQTKGKLLLELSELVDSKPLNRTVDSAFKNINKKSQNIK